MLALALAVAMQVPAPDTLGVADTAAVAPVSQVLELELDPKRGTWTGRLRARLAVRRATRHILLRLAGPEPRRIELATAEGGVPVKFGRHGSDSLLIETPASLAPGTATLSVSLAGTFVVAGPGLRRPDEKHVVLENGAGRIVPQWPAGTPETTWRLSVRAPAQCDVIASLPRATRSLQRDWGTWEFASGTPLPADSLRAEVRPLVPRPVRRYGGTSHRRPRRR